MDITREWLKAAAKGDGELKDTIMPLLHVRTLNHRLKRKKIILMSFAVDYRPATLYGRVPGLFKVGQDNSETPQASFTR